MADYEANEQCVRCTLILLSHSSTYRVVFVEEPGIFCHSSTYRAVFVEEPGIFCFSSTYRVVFVEEVVNFA
jgi:hypothetical protein